MLLAISFSGIFKPIGSVFKKISSAKFASIIDKVVMPVAGVAIGIKQAKAQGLPDTPPVQPPDAAPNAAAAAGAAKKPWYTNPVVYLGGAAVILLGALALSRRGN